MRGFLVGSNAPICTRNSCTSNSNCCVNSGAITSMHMGHSPHLDVFLGRPKRGGVLFRISGGRNARIIVRRPCPTVADNSNRHNCTANCTLHGNNSFGHGCCTGNNNCATTMYFHTTRTLLGCVRTDCLLGKALSTATHRC